MTNTTRYTLLAFVQDRPGVLNKIAILLRRKMYNIDTLTVCESEKHGISRMTITVHSEEPEKITQMMKQIKRLPEVISIANLDSEKSFWRETALLKVQMKKSKVEELKENYNIEILSENKGTIIIQIAGTSRNIDAFIGELPENNILEIARTGVTAMEETVEEDKPAKFDENSAG